MPIFHITYETENYYTKPVREATLELMVLPEDSKGQKCLSFEVQNSLEADPQFSESLFGARLIRFRLPRKFCSFKLTVNAIVQKDDFNPFDITEIDPEEQKRILTDFAFRIDNYRWLSVNEFTAPVNQLLPEEVMYVSGETLFQCMLRINNWVHENIIYKVGVTTTQTKLDEILEIRAGVCQDHAHLFIASMRANGIPARYVSGYLNQGQDFTGSLAMHAWAEAFLPGTGWIGFDPSNNLLANVHYIKIGHGLDYTDCMPIKGVLIAKGNGFTEYSVKVIEQQTQ